MRMHSALALRVWEAAIDVAARTRTVVAQFPPRGYGSLRDQMTRSSESIPSNIADGRGSSSAAEFLNYLDHASRSASELLSQLTEARKYGVASAKDIFNLIGTVICIRKMIVRLQERICADEQAQNARPTSNTAEAKRRRRAHHPPS